MVFMRKLILLIFLAGAIHTLALDNHFIYIQSENGKPFYLSLNSKVISSSSTGWLILPLAEGDYQVNIGFPRKEFPDYRFKFKVDKRDMGFVLKSLGDRGWGLQNIQNSELTRGDLVESASSLRNSSGSLSNDPFSTMLAAVVDDPSIREHPFLPVEEKPTNTIAKTDSAKTSPVSVAPVVGTTSAPVATNNPPAVATGKPAAKKGAKLPLLGSKKATTKKGTVPATDSLTVKDTLNAKPVDNVAKPTTQKTDSVAVAAMNTKAAEPSVKHSTAAKPVAVITPGVIRSSQSSNSEGIDLVYIDRAEDGTADTVRIFISKKIGEAVKPTVTAQSEQSKNSAQNDPRFLYMSVYPKSSTVDTINVSKPAMTKGAEKVDTTASTLPEAATINPNCKGLANDDDLFKLRKRMITKTDEDEMVMTALKEFKLHCYSADMIRSLSYIFLTQKGKYQLLDAAWPYVYDPSNFKKLGDILTDSYYINRFNALIQ